MSDNTRAEAQRLITQLADLEKRRNDAIDSLIEERRAQEIRLEEIAGELKALGHKRTRARKAKANA